jgi:hypothetical protein
VITAHFMITIPMITAHSMIRITILRDHGSLHDRGRFPAPEAHLIRP